MFTGIVEELGTVDGIDRQGDALRLTLHGPFVTADVRLGDSIAVNGCCLTVAERDGERFTADVMRETLERTTLGSLVVGERVNLERAVRVDARLGGHIVQGHVDGVGTVRARTPGADGTDRVPWEVVEIGLDPALSRYLVDQGSITVDGTSLTVVDAADDSFTVSLIPETLARTTLGARVVGDHVNLEVDVLAKYVERLLDRKETA